MSRRNPDRLPCYTVALVERRRDRIRLDIGLGLLRRHLHDRRMRKPGHADRNHIVLRNDARGGVG
jgi:hypothetical protein